MALSVSNMKRISSINADIYILEMLMINYRNIIFSNIWGLLKKKINGISAT